MAAPIRSATNDKYFKPPPLPYLNRAYWRNNDINWGKRHMIDFLIKLHDAWILDFRTKVSSPIIYGDISLNGGGDLRPSHNSHRTGVDVDIFIIRKDGGNKPTDFGWKDQYDFDRTLRLAQLIVRVAGKDLEKLFYDDQDVKNKVKEATSSEGPHRDHLHIRLKVRE
jgi:murein endopeptidase